MITSLTPEQEKLLAETYKRGLQIGYNCKPLNRPAVEAIITEIYALLNKPAPEFCYYQSPYAAMQAIKKETGACDWNYFNGQHWCGWELYYTFLEQIGVKFKETQSKQLALWMRQAEECSYWWPHENVCIVSERYTELHLDERGRLHNLDGKAVKYSDGWGLYAVHGVRLPEWIIEEKKKITSTEIDKEANAEIRRVMLDIFGVDRYMQESKAVVVEECSRNHPIVGLRTARLLQKNIPDDEPIIMLDMLNSTPEPDGSCKRYMIRIDPNAYAGQAAKSCLAAMASTYRLSDGSLLFKSPEDYMPAVES